jgi:glutathione S-transferase
MSAVWHKVKDAIELPGLRLVLSRGVPNPWAEAAKAVFEVKRIPFHRVTQTVTGSNAALQEWTGQTSAPVAVYERERPRTHWSEIILLAERLAPEPSLVPADPEQRAMMFGLVHEIAGQLGFGWCRRMHFTHAVLSDPESPLRPVGEYIAGRYGYEWADQTAIRKRIGDLLTMFATRLRRQRELGNHYFLGDRLTAVDLYWSTFAALLQPLPHEICPMHELSRALYTLGASELLAGVDPILLEHRDRIYREHLSLPVVLD